MKCQTLYVRSEADIACPDRAVKRTEDGCAVCLSCAAKFRAAGFKVVGMGPEPECNTLDPDRCITCIEHSGTCPGVPT